MKTFRPVAARSPLAMARLCVALIAAAGGAAAHGQVQVYGTIDVGVGRLSNQNPGAPTTAVTAVNGVHNGALQTSYLGLRGSEDLGGGLKASFAIEAFLRADNGANGRFDASPAQGADPFWSRSAWVGVSGGFGDLRLGNNANPLWVSMLQTNALGANSVFSPSFRQLYNGGARGRSEIDTSMVNSVVYQTPNLGGVQAVLAVQAGEGRGTRYNHAAHIGYRDGPLHVTLALQSARHSPPPDNTLTARQDRVLVGGSYNFGPVRVFGQYTTVDNVTNKSRLPHFGATVPLAGGTVQFSTGRDRNKVVATGATTVRTTTSAGYVYPLSKRTDLYGFLMSEKFPVVGPANNQGNSAIVGVRHAF